MGFHVCVEGTSKDIFSLGVVFFQLLTARVPRPGPDPVAGIFQALGGLGFRRKGSSGVWPRGGGQ